jgi:cobalamin synthase
MLIALWIVTFLAIVLWSLFAWGLLALATSYSPLQWNVQALIDRIPYAESFDLWFPGWQDLLRAIVDMLQAAFSLISDTAPTAVWVLWAVGVVFMLIASGAIMLIGRLLAREFGGKTPAPPQSATR